MLQQDPHHENQYQPLAFLQVPFGPQQHALRPPPAAASPQQSGFHRGFPVPQARVMTPTPPTAGGWSPRAQAPDQLQRRSVQTLQSTFGRGVSRRPAGGVLGRPVFPHPGAQRQLAGSTQRPLRPNPNMGTNTLGSSPRPVQTQRQQGQASRQPQASLGQQSGKSSQQWPPRLPTGSYQEPYNAHEESRRRYYNYVSAQNAAAGARLPWNTENVHDVFTDQRLRADGNTRADRDWQFGGGGRGSAYYPGSHRYGYQYHGSTSSQPLWGGTSGYIWPNQNQYPQSSARCPDGYPTQYHSPYTPCTSHGQPPPPRPLRPAHGRNGNPVTVTSDPSLNMNACLDPFSGVLLGPGRSEDAVTHQSPEDAYLDPHHFYFLDTGTSPATVTQYGSLGGSFHPLLTAPVGAHGNGQHNPYQQPHVIYNTVNGGNNANNSSSTTTAQWMTAGMPITVKVHTTVHTDDNKSSSGSSGGSGSAAPGTSPANPASSTSATAGAGGSPSPVTQHGGTVFLRPFVGHECASSVAGAATTLPTTSTIDICAQICMTNAECRGFQADVPIIGNSTVISSATSSSTNSTTTSAAAPNIANATPTSANASNTTNSSAANATSSNSSANTTNAMTGAAPLQVPASTSSSSAGLVDCQIFLSAVAPSVSPAGNSSTTTTCYVKDNIAPRYVVMQPDAEIIWDLIADDDMREFCQNNIPTAKDQHDSTTTTSTTNSETTSSSSAEATTTPPASQPHSDANTRTTPMSAEESKYGYGPFKLLLSISVPGQTDYWQLAASLDFFQAVEAAALKIVMAGRKGSRVPSLLVNNVTDLLPVTPILLDVEEGAAVRTPYSSLQTQQKRSEEASSKSSTTMKTKTKSRAS